MKTKAALSLVFLFLASCGLVREQQAQTPAERPYRCENPILVEQAQLLADIESGNLNFSGCTFASGGNQGLNLSGADLRDIQMGGYVLFESQLEGADMTRAQIINSDLTSVNLQNANLQGSVWQVSSLLNANLSNADLTGASFIGTNLTGAILTGATLTDVSTDADTICPDGNPGPCNF